MNLDQAFIDECKGRIERAIVPAMAQLYDRAEPTWPEGFRPGLKWLEKVVSYYDYWSCGISVLSRLAARGDAQALQLIRNVLRNCEHYRARIYGQPVLEGSGVWQTPLRRLLLHVALALRDLREVLDKAEQGQIRALLEEQVPIAIEHNRHFLPGERDLHLTFANNHTAIFMQGIWYCGQVLGRPDWVELTREFAERFYESGHPDGYWEENTNAEREGGPSLVYTRLTAGCLYDVLDGLHGRQDKFVRAGSVYRSLVTGDDRMMPIADERTNAHERGVGYGAALHTLTAPGRGFVVDALRNTDYSRMSPEGMAVLYHELDLMATGPAETPENRRDGSFRLSLPLGVIRRNGYMAGISAVRALNRVIKPGSDYALDQQAMVYLWHEKAGQILTGIKSKNNPDYSTFRIGEDAYTVRTGQLTIDATRAEALLLILRVDTDRPVTTTLTVGAVDAVRPQGPFERIQLPGFSPYSAGNVEAAVEAIRLHWTREVVVEFDAQ
jgi:hypothetical protein